MRRHLPGAADFAARLDGVTVTDAVRRGKFLWLPLESGEALLGHLGMSGQLLVQPSGAADERHLRVRLVLGDGPLPADGRELRFVDQRMFGGLAVVPLEPSPDGLPAGAGGAGGPSAAMLPAEVAHIARDPLDPYLDEELLLARVRRRRTGVKRALLDQSLLSGIGQHLRRRGAVAGAAALRAAHRHPDPAGVVAAARRGARGDAAPRWPRAARASTASTST